MERELIERLRDPNYAGPMQHLRSSDEIDRLFNSAADAIESLRAQLDEARKALERIANMEGTFGYEKGAPCRFTDHRGTRDGHAQAGVFANEVARVAVSGREALEKESKE